MKREPKRARKGCKYGLLSHLRWFIGCLCEDEFAIGIKQFHGEARSIDIFKLRKEVRRISEQLNRMAPQ